MSKPRLGLAICGSYCTFDKILPVAEALAADFELTVIMSENAAGTDTRFGCAENMRKRLEEISGREVICSIAAAEPIGPKKLLDILAVAPCTGNTLAKLAGGITDGPHSRHCGNNGVQGSSAKWETSGHRRFKQRRAFCQRQKHWRADVQERCFPCTDAPGRPDREARISY